MPNHYLSVLYKHIIQEENKNVGLKVGGHKHTIAPPPPIKKEEGNMPPPPPPPLHTHTHPLPTPVIYIYICFLLSGLSGMPSKSRPPREDFKSFTLRYPDFYTTTYMHAFGKVRKPIPMKAGPNAKTLSVQLKGRPRVSCSQYLK